MRLDKTYNIRSLTISILFFSTKTTMAAEKRKYNIQIQAKSQKFLWLFVVIKYPPTFLLFLLTAMVRHEDVWMQYSTIPPWFLLLFVLNFFISDRNGDCFLCPRTNRDTRCFLASSTITRPISFPCRNSISTWTWN